MKPALHDLAPFAAIIGAGLVWLAFYRRQRAASPAQFGRSAKEAMRSRWLSAVLSQPSHYLLAVQTIRNSIMAASFIASALAVLVAGVAAWAPELARIGTSLFGASTLGSSNFRLAVAALCALVAITYFLTSIRFYHQLGYAFVPGLAKFEPASNDEQFAQMLLLNATRCYGNGMSWTFALIAAIAWILSPWLAVAAILVIATTTLR